MTRNDYGTPTDPLNAPDHASWAASVAADLDGALLAVVPTGAVTAFGGNVAPAGWHLCDGTAHGSAALEAVLGSANAPDLRGRFVLHVYGAYGMHTTGGEETHVLSAGEMPAHHHRVSLEYGGGVDPTQAYPGQYNQVRAGGSGYPTWVDAAVEDTGGSAAHNNMPPYYALVYIIKT